MVYYHASQPCLMWAGVCCDWLPFAFIDRRPDRRPHKAMKGPHTRAEHNRTGRPALLWLFNFERCTRAEDNSSLSALGPAQPSEPSAPSKSRLKIPGRQRADKAADEWAAGRLASASCFFLFLFVGCMGGWLAPFNSRRSQPLCPRVCCCI